MSVRNLALALAGLALLAGPAAAGPGKKKDAPKLTQIVYPVADLVIPIDYSGEGKQLPPQEDKLLDLLRTTVAPKSWVENGGPGQLQYFPLGMSLVVSQTREVQEQVRDVLAALRRLQDIQVVIEAKVVALPDEIAERYQADERFTGKDHTGAATQTWFAFVGPETLKEWLTAWQADSRTNVLSAPKITGFSGQMMKVQTGTQQVFVTDYKAAQRHGEVSVEATKRVVETGLRLEIKPTISADRKFVHLDAAARMTSLGEMAPTTPVKIRIAKGDEEEQEFVGQVQQPTVQTVGRRAAGNVPDGDSMVVVLGKQLVESRQECCPPLLSQVPYLNRLFTNVGCGRETRTLVVVLTPRVIDVGEQD